MGTDQHARAGEDYCEEDGIMFNPSPGAFDPLLHNLIPILWFCSRIPVVGREFCQLFWRTRRLLRLLFTSYERQSRGRKVCGDTWTDTVVWDLVDGECDVMVEHVSDDERVCRSSNCDDDDGTRNRIGVRYYYTPLWLVGKSCKLARCYYLLYACLPSIPETRSCPFVWLLFCWLALMAQAGVLGWTEVKKQPKRHARGRRRLMWTDPLLYCTFLLLAVVVCWCLFPINSHTRSPLNSNAHCDASWRTIRFIVLWLSLYPHATLEAVVSHGDEPSSCWGRQWGGRNNAFL